MVDIDDDLVTISGDGVGRKYINNSDGGLKISFKGNEKTNYHINIKTTSEHKDYYIDLVLQHWNWWDVDRINVEIKIDTRENTISYSIENKFISEEKNYKEDTIEETNIKELSTINEIYIG